MRKLIAKYIENEDGATAIEYGLIVASIAVAVSAVAILIGSELETTFNTVLGYLTR